MFLILFIIVMISFLVSKICMLSLLFLKHKQIYIKKGQMKITHFKKTKEQQNTHQLKSNSKL